MVHRSTRPLILLVLAILLLPSPAGATGGGSLVEIEAEDGLKVTAIVKRRHRQPGAPMIVLFHQAGWSHGEYNEIALRLSLSGYNYMVVDQRSGGTVNGVENPTAKRAEAEGRSTTYVDALPDMRAALRYARTKYRPGTLIAWGSSYSASLVLKLAGDEPELLDAAMAFSPGEYFTRMGKPADWIRTSAAAIEQPVFITSARKEHGAWAAIAEAIPSATKTTFVPDTEGNHGSRALWARFPDSKAYWSAVESFLQQFRPPAGVAKGDARE